MAGINRVSSRVAVLLSALIALIADGSAADRLQPGDNPGPALFDLTALSQWFAARFPDEPPLAREQLRVQSYACGCNDKPAHYPYRIVLIGTPKGDVVARPEGQEGAVGIAPIAMRFGERYCKLDSDTNCYGSFTDPCEFTDFRYGTMLAEFFPSCKVPAPPRP